MANSEKYFLGIDVGTQSVRAGVFDAFGRRLGMGVSPIETFHPQPAWAEQQPVQWWDGLRQAIPAAMRAANIPATLLAGIGLDCTACTVVACDAEGKPLRPALLWMDQRAHAEACEINATADASLRWVSGVVSPEWMLPKAMWLKRHESETIRRSRWIIEGTDWIMHRLTGEWSLSLNHVAVKWNYVAPEGGWSADLLRRIGLEEIRDKWPGNIVALGQGQATLSAPAAEFLGLCPGTPIAHGGIDAYAGMLGLGAVASGKLAMIMGSSTCHLVNSDKPLLGTGMLGCYADAIRPGLYTLEGGQTATGSIVNWYRQHFAGNESAEAERTGRSVFELLDEKASRVPPGCEGLQCLDHWQGARTPIKDPLSRGVWSGLTLAHGPGHLLRSIYEATAYGTRHILEDLNRHGLSVTQLLAGGGGARSSLWLQIHADVCAVPVSIPAETETCMLGSAMLAAIHTGQYQSLEEAASNMVRMEQVIEPNKGFSRAYDAGFGNYQRLYQAMQGMRLE